jgi:hypothetical protein
MTDQVPDAARELAGQLVDVSEPGHMVTLWMQYVTQGARGRDDRPGASRRPDRHR